ncbi:pyocin S6 family toxin immunity protein [Pseudomonas helleri]|uniref:pyocin S6 family toxin immunity protein n=2 Tax=Pseudomonas helleri TaxID=1608996 RepID=UPI0034DAEADA
MYFQMTGFLPEPDPDDSLKFKQALGGDLEADALEIMGWKSLEDAGGWETEVSPDQAILFAKLLGQPQLVKLTLFIGCVA